MKNKIMERTGLSSKTHQRGAGRLFSQKKIRIENKFMTFTPKFLLTDNKNSYPGYLKKKCQHLCFKFSILNTNASDPETRFGIAQHFQPNHLLSTVSLYRNRRQRYASEPQCKALRFNQPTASFYDSLGYLSIGSLQSLGGSNFALTAKPRFAVKQVLPLKIALVREIGQRANWSKLFHQLTPKGKSCSLVVCSNFQHSMKSKLVPIESRLNASLMASLVPPVYQINHYFTWNNTLSISRKRVLKRQVFVKNSLKGILLVNFPEKEKNFLIKNLAAENKIPLIRQSASLLLKDSRNMDDLLGVDDPIQVLFDKVKASVPCICVRAVKIEYKPE